MKDFKFFGIFLLVAILFQAACAAQNRLETSEIGSKKASETPIEANSKERTPVLVELFTSEG